MNPEGAPLYRIEVQGRLPAGVAEQLPGMTVEAGPRTTVLVGPIDDPAALYGVIGRLESLGLCLVGIARTSQRLIARTERSTPCPRCPGPRSPPSPPTRPAR